MEEIQFEMLPSALLNDYLRLIDKSALKNFEALKDNELSVKTFSFYTSVSAVFSSRIEGEDIELDSFIKHKLLGIKFLPDHTQKTDDLYNAYRYAQNERMTPLAIKQAHTLLTKHILQKAYRGRIRTSNMFVTTPDGKIEYVACAPAKVKTEIDKLYKDIASLQNTPLTFEEAFYFAALIHLVFVKIHPFDDGNGRTARLLEKWFLAQKLGPKAWFVQSERYYYNRHALYYKNIRLMGLEYDLLDYRQAIPFLLMLPEALTNLKDE
jgi:Fic family protein